MRDLPRAATDEPELPKLIGLGLLAAAFFSVTFVLNRLMSVSGGHWVWSAALRYLFMAILLSTWIALRRGPRQLLVVFREFTNHIWYWLRAGGVGFGIFYICLCFAADQAPGWLIAATWQSTIVASLLVLLWFKKPVPKRGVLFIALIFMGVSILNAHRLSEGVHLNQVLLGALPVLIAAFAYPFGNQWLKEARELREEMRSLDTAAGILLMTLGALPVLTVLTLAIRPPWPAKNQIENTLLVAFFAGCLATSLFYKARDQTKIPYRIAAVDATQGGEVVFALLGEVAILGAPIPDVFGVLGLLAVIGGFVGFFLHSPSSSNPTDTSEQSNK